MNATGKILHLLCMCFVFVSCVAMADVLPEPSIVKVNNILVYENVANRIFKDAYGNKIKVDVRNVDAVSKDIKDAFIDTKDSKLMNEVVKLYNAIMLDNTSYDIGYKKSEDGKIKIAVDKEKKIITIITIND